MSALASLDSGHEHVALLELRRDFGLKRCRYHGSSGMGRWVGWGIVTHNLVKIAEAGSAR